MSVSSFKWRQPWSHITSAIVHLFEFFLWERFSDLVCFEAKKRQISAVENG